MVDEPGGNEVCAGWNVGLLVLKFGVGGGFMRPAPWKVVVLEDVLTDDGGDETLPFEPELAESLSLSLRDLYLRNS